MENVQSLYSDLCKSDPSIMGAILVSQPEKPTQIVDGFDLLLLVVCAEDKSSDAIFHYIKEGKYIQERRVNQLSLERWVLEGQHRKVLQWIMYGEIIVDDDAYLAGLRKRIASMPKKYRERKLFIEFSQFLKHYLKSREYLENNHVLDAYSSILLALHRWARIVIIEKNRHPELTVWKQVQQINPGVYKLYEELTLSQETLKERVQLVLLACEFSVISKMKESCRFLLDLFQQHKKKGPLSVDEINTALLSLNINVELSLILNKLVKRGLLQEVLSFDERSSSLQQIKYEISSVNE